MFRRNEIYTRAQISSLIGGNRQSCFLTSCGHVVGICYVPNMNPRAPEVIYVGRGPMKEKAAASLAAQAEGVPVFEKQDTNAWRFIGSFKGTRYSQIARDVRAACQGSGRDDVVGILGLQRIL